MYPNLPDRQPLCCCEITVSLLLKPVCHSGDAGRSDHEGERSKHSVRTHSAARDMREHLHHITQSTACEPVTQNNLSLSQSPLMRHSRNAGVTGNALCAFAHTNYKILTCSSCTPLNHMTPDWHLPRRLHTYPLCYNKLHSLIYNW